jgi:DNA-binding FrmR family transcriptional regulator
MTDDTSDTETPQDIQDLVRRISRIRGQVDGVKNMIEDREYCIDLINQIHSVKRALDGLATQIMEDHMKGCVRDAINSDDPLEEQEKMNEFMDTVRNFLKK